MRSSEKKRKAARDLARARPELGTDGGAPTAVRRVVGLTSAPVKVDDPEIRNRYTGGRNRRALQRDTRR
jgi:hypothetical protein